MATHWSKETSWQEYGEYLEQVALEKKNPKSKQQIRTGDGVMSWEDSEGCPLASKPAISPKSQKKLGS